MAKYRVEGWVQTGVLLEVEARSKKEAIKKVEQDNEYTVINEGPWSGPVTVDSHPIRIK